jgi:hypothetical protein
VSVPVATIGDEPNMMNNLQVEHRGGPGRKTGERLVREQRRLVHPIRPSRE